MYILDCGTFQVGRAPAEEAIWLWGESHARENLKYLIAETPYTNINNISRLLAAGAMFHDRVLSMEIAIRSIRNIRRTNAGRISGIIICEQSEVTEDLLLLANRVFLTDRRFHLELPFELGQAMIVLRAYLKEYQKKGLRVLCARYQEKNVGYTVVCDVGNKTAENILGVTEPSIAGKAAAFGLYCTTLDQMERWGYERYLGQVSSANQASLNLHMQLGARVVKVMDHYILRRN